MARQPGKPPADRPTVDLKTEAEVWLVREALSQQAERLKGAVAHLTERKVPQAFMMARKLEKVQSVLATIPEAIEHHLPNKEQVDRAAEACEHMITHLRLAQFKHWCPTRSAMILVLSPLLDRIRIGWKKPAPIPEEVLAQIKAREDGRFYNQNVGDWLDGEAPREDEMDVYMWRLPEFDLVEDFEWVGLCHGTV